MPGVAVSILEKAGFALIDIVSHKLDHIMAYFSHVANELPQSTYFVVEYCNTMAKDQKRHLELFRIASNVLL